MKRFQLAVCMLAISLLFAADANAQRRGMSGMMRMMGASAKLNSTLLVMEEVREELDLSDEQSEKITEAADELNGQLREELRAIMQDGGEMSEVDELIKEIMEEEKEIVELLNDEQKTRLGQLRFQRMGNAVYQDEKIQEELGLSDEQKATLKEAVENNTKELEEAMADARESGGFGGIRETMASMRKKLGEEIGKVLTDEQTEKVAEMKGDEFEFPQRRRGGRRGRSDF